MTADTATVNGFRTRHIGPDRAAHSHMLDVLGYPSVDSLIDAAVPRQIRCADGLRLPAARSEQQVLDALRAMAGRNATRVQMIGLGYYDTITPAVLRRNMLESPAWYTAYTPYQPEISQGRLEALLTFQTVIEDLTALPVAGASLLDEATAVMEAVLLMRRASKTTPKSKRVVLDADCLPQTLAVVRGRAAAVGIEVLVVDTAKGLPDVDAFGVVLQSPGASGALRNLAPLIAAAHERGMLTAVAADLLSLTLVAAPGDQGADIAVGSAQRFGVPLFFGGPHAGYMAVRAGLERMLPGRLVGVSVDVDGQPAYRLALQTREQHIRRDKATSNICTAQALLANIAAMFAAYHGPEGLRAIAARVHRHAVTLAAGLREAGYEIVHDRFFDTVMVRVTARAQQLVAAAESVGINLRLVDADHVGISCDECTTDEVIRRVLDAFGAAPPATVDGSNALPVGVLRTSEYLTHPVFHQHRSETAMMRFLRELSDKDLALDRTMIPLGSCTMKLNAAAEMEPVSWPGFAGVHPYAPAEQTAGYLELIGDLEAWLAEITGYDRVSLQPNAGSQGEIAGLLAVNAYHRSRGDLSRDVCLIPQSAHGTNAASAVLAGMRVVVVRTAPNGNIDIDDLKSKIAANEGTVAAIMLTYPSTHGVYESDVRTVCDLVHRAGGQVYVDGANLNALVGLAKPGEFGGDVSHLNLHKTFCIPHGGGGPGVGPVAVRAHLAPFLPGDPLSVDGPAPVSAANHGSAGILPITWAYLALMGPDGLTAATKAAVLAANYLAASLATHYPVLYTGESGLVAHECILDLREITKRTGVTAEDVAKRLIDYGFHAPTLSFPVNGTLMVEPTESEDLPELDRFVTAMISIHDEISRVESGEWALDQSPLRQAPHTAEQVTATEWVMPYTRQYAAYPVAALRLGKYWPPVRRIDGVHGDRNLACSCPPPEAFQTDVTRTPASPLLDEHRELGATFTDFAGWAMPLKYGSELAEHRAVRESAGLFDLSHMGEIVVTGLQSAEALDFALVGEASKIPVGKAKYSLICDTSGGVIDDLVVYRLADDDFLVVANAANTGTVARELVLRAEEFDAVVDDRSALTALIAVQGPASEDIVASLVPCDQREAARSLKYYSVIDAYVGGVNVLLARTGYTGEDGFELYVPNARAVALWRSLLAATTAAGGSPAGLASRDTLRLEAGMALYGQELSQATNPFQAGLGKVVKLGRNFVGREALQHVSELSADRVLVGLKGSTRRAARPGYTVHQDSVGAAVGTVTSGALSPTLGYPIALAYLDATLAEPGTVVKVDIRGNSEQFEVTPTPFYRRK